MFHYLHSEQKDMTNKLVVSPRARLIHDSEYGFLQEAVYDQHSLSILPLSLPFLDSIIATPTAMNTDPFPLGMSRGARTNPQVVIL